MTRIRIHAGIFTLAAALLVSPVAASAQTTTDTATTRAADDRDDDNNEGFDKGLLGLLGLLGLAGLRRKPDHVHVDRDVHVTPGTTGGTGTPGSRRP